MQSSAGMPLFGGNVPTYHPSIIPRGRAGSPHASDMGLHPTSPEALDDLLKQLKSDRRTLEVMCILDTQIISNTSHVIVACKPAGVWYSFDTASAQYCHSVPLTEVYAPDMFNAALP